VETLVSNQGLVAYSQIVGLTSFKARIVLTQFSKDGHFPIITSATDISLLSILKFYDLECNILSHLRFSKNILIICSDHSYKMDDSSFKETAMFDF
jgi:hypothetical protein